MVLTHIKTGKKYEVGTKKIKSDTTEYSRPDGYKKQIIKTTYGSDKPKMGMKKSTTMIKAKPSASRKPAAKERTDVQVREFFPQSNKVEPRGPVLTKIEPTIGKFTTKASPKSVPNPPAKSKAKYGKFEGVKFRKEYQVPTGNKGNKPTMSASDRKKGGGKNKLKIGI